MGNAGSGGKAKAQGDAEVEGARTGSCRRHSVIGREAALACTARDTRDEEPQGCAEDAWARTCRDR